jgi:hypothetical protein
MGWRLLQPIPRHFAVFPDAVEKAASLLRLSHPDWPEDRAHALVRFFALKDMAQRSAQYSHTVPATWDSFDWPKVASRIAGAARDLSYLIWRYVNHPCFEYRLIAIPGANHTGIAVWRLETIRRVTDRGTEELDKIGRLVEFLPASLENAGDLLSVVWNELAVAGAIGADFYGYHLEHRNWLSKCGFRPVEEHADGSMIPSRFQPVESRSQTILGAVLAQNELPFYPGESHGMWYWTKSDADQDRPN